MRFAIRFGALAAAGAVLAVLAGGADSQAAGNSADSFAVDMDTTGNTATALGTRDDCAEVAAGSSVVIDVTATNVPAATKMIAFTFELTYDKNAISITGNDFNGLLGTAPGAALSDFSDTPPDTDGTYAAATSDFTSAGASGTGYLQRLTLGIAAGATPGQYALTLTPGQAAHVDTQTTGHPPDALLSATLAVGTGCGLMGDVDCSDGATPVDAVDALKVLRHVASLSVNQNEPCANIGTGGPPVMGDVDCSGGATPVDAVDALKVLRHVASLSVNQNEPCTNIGT